MSDFSLSNSQTIDANPEARAALDKALSSFASKPVVSGTVTGAVNTAPTAEVVDSDELSPILEAPEEAEAEEATEEVEGEPEEGDEEPELSAFEQEFSKRFGVKPEEAVNTINELIAFRDEMALMRGWGVAASEYDSRMNQVREFYKTLPEDKQPEFNSVEGAKAIWEHLEKQNPTRKRTSTTSKLGGSKKPASTQSKKEFIKKSEILSWDRATYEQRLPEITRAYREGRVLEDR